MSRTTNGEPLGQVIQQLLHVYGLQEGCHAAAISTYWDQIVGAAIARHTGRISLKKGLLRVEIYSAVVRQELSYMRSELCTRINQRLNARVVQDITFY